MYATVLYKRIDIQIRGNLYLGMFVVNYKLFMLTLLDFLFDYNKRRHVNIS